VSDEHRAAIVLGRAPIPDSDVTLAFSVTTIKDVKLPCITWSVQGALLIHRTGYHLIIICSSDSSKFDRTSYWAASTILPALLIWFTPGASWFHHELIPAQEPVVSLEARTRMAIWQLGNCAFRKRPLFAPFSQTDCLDVTQAIYYWDCSRP
jgi:hypothetical protein